MVLCYNLQIGAGMGSEAIRSLFVNAIILVSLAFLHQMVGLRAYAAPRMETAWKTLGVTIAALGAMLNPWIFGGGIVFDTRSVILSVSGLLFGAVPTVTAMGATMALRLANGGGGVYMGVATILTSGLIGLGWRWLRHSRLETIRRRELYLFGLLVHLNMLFWTILLPATSRAAVLDAILLPVLVLYPLVTVAIGAIMTQRLAELRVINELRQHRAFRANIMDTSPVGIVVIDAQGKIEHANPMAARVLHLQRPSDVESFSFDSEAWQITAPDGGPFPPEQLPFAVAMQRREAVYDVRHAIRGLADGSLVQLSVNAAPILDESGELESVVATVTDVTAAVEAELHIRRLNRLYALLSGVNQSIVRIADRPTLFRAACDVAIGQGEYAAAAVVHGDPPEVVASAARTPAARSHIEAQAVVHAGATQATRIGAMAVLPLRQEARQVGAMVVSAAPNAAFDAEELQLLEEMAEDISFALDFHATRERELAARRALEAGLAEKTVLLREIHHRVKNNLNVVASLLALQGDRTASAEHALEALRASRNRVFAMARVHDALYQSDDFSAVNVREVFAALADELLDVYDRRSVVTIHIEVGESQISIDQAIPLTLIVQELLSNSLRHSFGGGESGELSLVFFRAADGMLELRLTANGAGCRDAQFQTAPTELADSGTRHELGRELVEILTLQLRGQLFLTTDPVTCAVVRFEG